MATPTFQGITAAEYRDKGSVGAYTPITKLVAEESQATRPPHESVQNTVGGTYYGGENPTAEVMHLDSAAHNALATKYATDGEVELRVTFVGGGQESYIGLPEVTRKEIQGQSGGRVVYGVKVVTFALSPAV